MPSCVVGVDGARRIRRALVARLFEADRPGLDWEAFVDEEVFNGDVALRMHGSRKPGAARQGGRLYHVIGRVDGDGDDDVEALARYEAAPVELLRDVSIRAVRGQDVTVFDS